MPRTMKDALTPSGDGLLDSALRGFRKATKKLERAIEEFDREEEIEQETRKELRKKVQRSTLRSHAIDESRARAERVLDRFKELLA